MLCSSTPSTNKPQVNWHLAEVDLLVIDELSVVPVKIFQHILDTIQQLHTEIEDKDIRSVLLNQPEAVILTVSCAAASRVNRVALDSLFEDQQFLGEVQYDNELGRVALYRGMKVLITQNRDKEHGVVNGQPATVLYHENASIFLEHPKGYICCIYPVTQ
ncbi:hypothetical protein OS493_035654 [Desmophyllum pertusum]|uniref:Uncharacterized protein n=1 Tax=Desmophyllum pertusum TaxID=174260 RepID=A0A9W9Z6R7_9CNID|nr:hypothetical protein OS493_035654 [Desmophyllum pertusum]